MIGQVFVPESCPLRVGRVSLALHPSVPVRNAHYQHSSPPHHLLLAVPSPSVGGDQTWCWLYVLQTLGYWGLIRTISCTNQIVC